MVSTVAYVSNAASAEITVLALDERSGALATLQSVPCGGMVMPLALSPDRRALYAARRSEPLAVLAFAIGADGRLAPLGEAPLPASMAHIATDETGRWVFSASYGGHLVAVSPIDEQARPQPATQVLTGAPNAHAMRAAPGNHFVFATSLGSDRVLQFRFDAGSGRLVPNDPPAVVVLAGAGPRHLAFHPHAPFAYLLDELDASLVVFALDRERGTLHEVQTVTTLPPGFSGAPWAADLHLTTDGRFLYTSERRSSTLAAFTVDATSGRVEPAGHFATQAQPRGFAITPSGRWLLAAGQLSHRVGVHAIDAATGALACVGEHAVGQDPNWIEIVSLENP